VPGIFRDFRHRDIPLPGDLRAGDLLAIPASGAYQRSMSSNDKHVPHPPVVAAGEGRATIMVWRETEQNLLRLHP
jgi:diaminopimelate decarboxylase